MQLKKWQNQNQPKLDAIEKRIHESMAMVEQRKSNLPAIHYDEQLPIVQYKQQIADLIRDHQVVIVAGETGSGKTTQLPKICLDIGRGAFGYIGHTQPRRIAARSIASRLAQELNSEVGRHVGYKVRFTDHSKPHSLIKVMTDGILLAELESDRYLTQYDTLIIDEAHERSLNIDFILGYLKQLLPARPELKVIITSATIDTQRFANHFNAPLIEVSGRLYPVQVHYRPPLLNDDQTQMELAESVKQAIDEISAYDARGDILVFLAGERDIRDCHDYLRKHLRGHNEILPLFSRLSASAQNAIFATYTKRKIILATNVAETSLTVPGIRYVIDSGLARISRYSYRNKVQRLPVEKISQASANQRKGRCGRVSDGVCYRLYAEEDFLNRPEFTDPEIVRTNLAAVILKMKSAGLGHIEHFPFLDPPDQRFINDGYRLLNELGAFGENHRLNDIGRNLAKIPIDPTIARMILAAAQEDCLSEMLVIAAVLSIQDPRERPAEAQARADMKHSEFHDVDSDLLFFVKLWERIQSVLNDGSKNQLRRFCREYFLSYIRVREWLDIHDQLREIIESFDYLVNQQAADNARISRALLSGIIGNVGLKEENGQYLGGRGIRFVIFPGSSLAKKTPKWIAAAQLIETSRLFAHYITRVQPEWIEKTAAHLIKHHYTEPHWNDQAKQVQAYESISLYGIPIVSRRVVNYEAIDEAVSRELFIHNALVLEKVVFTHPAIKHNRALISAIREQENKKRRHDLLVNDERLCELYAQRIPPHVVNAVQLNTWLKTTDSASIERLRFSESELLQAEPSAQAADFPEYLTVCGNQLPLTYHFEPGHARDGVTLTVPAVLLSQIPRDILEWIVPGLRLEKAVALIKSLPKSLRRSFVPAPEFAKAGLEAIDTSQGSFLIALANQLQRITGIRIESRDWNESALSPHLRMNINVVDMSGNTVCEGRDLETLKTQLMQGKRNNITTFKHSNWNIDNVTTWNFGDLPDTCEINLNGVRVTGYPALCIKDGVVCVSVFDDNELALSNHRRGVAELFVKQSKSQISYMRNNLSHISKLCMQYAVVGSCEQLKRDLESLIIFQALYYDADPIRSEQSYVEHKRRAQAQLLSTANAICGLIGNIMEKYTAIQKRVNAKLPLSAVNAIADIRSQLQHMIFAGFVMEIPYDHLQQLPRYLDAIEVRLNKLQHSPANDSDRMRQVCDFWNHYLQLEERDNIDKNNKVMILYRWGIEELRISLFAQEIKTIIPISAKRLEKIRSQLTT